MPKSFSFESHDDLGSIHVNLPDDKAPLVYKALQAYLEKRPVNKETKARTKLINEQARQLKLDNDEKEKTLRPREIRTKCTGAPYTRAETKAIIEAINSSEMPIAPKLTKVYGVDVLSGRFDISRIDCSGEINGFNLTLLGDTSTASAWDNLSNLFADESSLLVVSSNYMTNKVRDFCKEDPKRRICGYFSIQDRPLSGNEIYIDAKTRINSAKASGFPTSDQQILAEVGCELIRDGEL